ncbi:UNVERIFIED_CONTAM: hypothetical protein H355_016612 [Colinus virginianus]|nr:hypothetical protein H355_016612 [Colinus virginianus]
MAAVVAVLVRSLRLRPARLGSLLRGWRELGGSEVLRYRVAEVIEQADYLYGSGETEKLYQLLVQHKNSEDAELLWRLARASRDLAQLSITSAEEKRQLTYDSHEYAKKALEKNESNSAAHKWYAICLSDVGDYEGIKVKIGNAFVIKEHFQRAIELNPKDATSIHLMGVWCYSFAELPWYQRKIAAVLFAAPPTSTYEEVRAGLVEVLRIANNADHFERELSNGMSSFWVLLRITFRRIRCQAGFLQNPADPIIGFCTEERKSCPEVSDPNFYSKNLLFLGKTYLKLNNKKMALLWLSKAKEYPAHTEEDKQVQKEALELLNSI